MFNEYLLKRNLPELVVSKRLNKDNIEFFLDECRNYIDFIQGVRMKLPHISNFFSKSQNHYIQSCQVALNHARFIVENWNS